MKLRQLKKQSGSVLLESLISVLIFSLGILALVGLQGVMIKNTSEAKYRADAAFIAQQRLSEIALDAENSGAYEELDTDIATLLPGGKRTTTVEARRFVTVTVSWAAPGTASDANFVDGKHQFKTSSFIGVAN